MNEEAVKKSLPTANNVMPIRYQSLISSAFLNKFVTEAKVYEENKSSAKWPCTDLAARQREHLAELDSF